jgi:hypothetical protein
MAYIRTKTIYGRQYRYLVEGKWVDGKVVQKVLKYLGPAEPVYGRKNGKPDTIRAEGKL